MSSPADTPPLILASRSPRRAGLLEAAGYRFQQIPSCYDEAAHEPGDSATPADLALELSQAKAKAVAANLEQGVVLGCDTLVEIDGEALGKADSPGNAAEMIRRLAGRDHDVITAICVIDAADGRSRCAVDRATVTLGPLEETEIEEHVQSGRWQGKAGAYNLEEMQDRWPLSVRGDASTVVGLPMTILAELLSQFRRTAPATDPDTAVEARWDGVLGGRDRSISAHLLRAATGIVEPFYRGLIALRNHAYDRGWKQTVRAGKPVISIGNLTVGGTGKTPMVIYTARLLLDRGYHPAIILRGYRADADGSDEQRLIAESLDGVPVVANPDRVAAAALLEQHSEVNCLVLDDAFQHRRIGRNLDLVLIDATNAFGFDHVLPRGLLREAPGGLSRADAVVITRADLIGTDQLEAVRGRVKREHGRPPLAEVRHEWAGILDEHDAPIAPSPDRVFAFAGIGNPGAFLRQAARHYTIAGHRVLPDHFRYDLACLQEMIEAAKASGADALLTTEKDFVKLRPLIREQPLDLPVWRPRLRLGFGAGQGELDNLILATVAGGSPTENSV